MDEDDLEDELAALENEWDMEKELGMDTPSYIPSGSTNTLYIYIY